MGAGRGSILENNGNKAFNMLEKYKGIPLPAKAALWYSIMSVFQKGIMFLITPLYTRILSPQEYGYYSLFATWMSVFSILATLNLSGGGFNNAMLKYEHEKKKYIASMMGLGNVCTIIIFIAIIFLHKYFSKWCGIDNFTLTCIFVVLLVTPAVECWISAQRFYYNYRIMCVVIMLQALLIPSVSVLFVYFLQEKKYALIIGSTLVQFVIGLIVYVYNLFEGKCLYKKDYWKFALHFNLPLVPHYLASIILGQADRIMIRNICGEDKVGIYSLGYNVSLLVNIFVTAIVTAFAPWVFRKIKDNNTKEVQKYSNYIIILVGGITILSVLVGPEIISIIGTKEYEEAKWILAPVMVSCYLTLIYSLFANIEFYYEKSVFVMIASALAAVSNVGLNAVFIPKYGFIAAGYTTLMSYVILVVIHYIFMRVVMKNKRLKNIYSDRFIFLFSCIIVSFSILSLLFYNKTIIRYMIFVIVIALLLLNYKRVCSIIKKVRENGDN